jgi:hydroxymethylglutaryl-CoA lyase
MDFQRKIKLIECPRDAMQGWAHFIPTAKKIEYINALLKVGFDTIDFGSFVSPKAIPQMADTKDVLKGLALNNTNTKLLAIIANTRGAEEAVVYDEISYLGFPFSVSETFQQRNTNASIADSFSNVELIHHLCVKNRKEMVVYISMGFGNPYGDVYNEEIVFEWVNKLVALGIKTISLADTVGVATAEQVNKMTSYLIQQLPEIEIGVHLHSTPLNWKDKMDAALEAGCTRFDGALKGIGGCPMAGDDLVGNMNTELMLPYLIQKGLLSNINDAELKKAMQLATEIFI